MTTDGTPPPGTTGLDAARYRFTTDRADVDRAAVHRWLSERSYWARGRSRATQDAAFARVVTDGATFAWLCDVFVDEEHRGGGVGVALVAGTVAHLEALGLPRVVLATADAHGLYERFGFAPVQEGRYLALLRDPAAPPHATPGSVADGT